MRLKIFHFTLLVFCHMISEPLGSEGQTFCMQRRKEKRMDILQIWVAIIKKRQS